MMLSGLFWENKVELELKGEVEGAVENPFENSVTPGKVQTSEVTEETGSRSQGVKDEDEESVVSSLDITGEQGEEDILILDEGVQNGDGGVRDCEGEVEDGFDQNKEKLDQHFEEEDDFVMVAPILEDEEYSSNELVLELDDDDFFFDANKTKGSVMITS